MNRVGILQRMYVRTKQNWSVDGPGTMARLHAVHSSRGRMESPYSVDNAQFSHQKVRTKETFSLWPDQMSAGYHTIKI